MKNLMTKCAALLAVAAFAISFTCCQSPTPAQPEPAAERTAIYAVPYDTFKTDTARYNQIIRAVFNGNDPIKAFTIRSSDLTQVMGMPQGSVGKAAFKDVRFYMGLTADSTFKLYLVPVVDAKLNAGKGGYDSIPYGKFEGNPFNTSQQIVAVQEGQYVYDFTAPCPTTCPEQD